MIVFNNLGYFCRNKQNSYAALSVHLSIYVINITNYAKPALNIV